MHTARKGINSNYIDFAATAEAIAREQPRPAAARPFADRLFAGSLSSAPRRVSRCP